MIKDRETLSSIVLWVGIALFSYFFWQIKELNQPPSSILECLGVGAWLAAAFLATIEIFWNALGKEISNFDRNYFRVFLVGVTAIGIAILHHAIVTGQGWLLIIVSGGSLLYFMTIRMPFVILAGRSN
ncbi:hypothetical protein [Undibacterium sp. Tian12W]|uniref:hypothetical protein n=1 Tax=Undibacterium sp. Tian12W TaxID=3413054 RepID=UPI003BF172F9